MPDDTALLLDEAAIRRLVDGYAFAVDRRDAEAFVGLFTADGSLCVHTGHHGPEHHCYDGREELATVIDKVRRYEQTLHAITSHRVDVTGDTATGETHCLAHHISRRPDGAAEDRILHITYEDEYRRADEAPWRISRRAVHARWTEIVTVDAPPVGAGGERS